MCVCKGVGGGGALFEGHVFIFIVVVFPCQDKGNLEKIFEAVASTVPHSPILPCASDR